jgi:hypothetical protein
MEGIFINMSNSDSSTQEIYNRFIREKEGENLSQATLMYYYDCFKSFRQVS